jgi:predicted transposase/invertase (TIGR01784 family)
METNNLRHDAIFKKHMGDIAIAGNFLEKHLPEALRERCDFNTLDLCSGSFVETNLRHQYSDMLYSIKTHEGKGYIYFLVEHQSSPDRFMAFRLLRYSLAVIQQHLDKGHKTIPLIVPLLFYHGRQSPYPYSNNWLDCFAEPELAGKIYNDSFPLVDITVVPDKEIMTHGAVAALELVQKHIRHKAMIELVEDLAEILNRWPLSAELFKSLMIYISQDGNSPDVGEFIDKLARLAPRYREDVMTIAQQLKEIGITEGHLQGKKQGMMEGRIEGKIQGKIEGKIEGKMEEKNNIAKQLFSRGLDSDLIKDVTGLTTEQLESLKH